MTGLTEADLQIVCDIAADRIRANFTRAQLAALTWQPTPPPPRKDPTCSTD